MATTSPTCGREEWEAFVGSHPGATPYHRWTWGAALDESCGTRTLRVVCRDRAGAVSGVLPLSLIRHSALGRGACSTPFYHPCGPLVVTGSGGDDILAALLAGAEKTLWRAGALYAEILWCPGWSGVAADASAWAAAGWRVQARETLVVPLPGSEPELMASYHSSFRRAVGRGRREGGEVFVPGATLDAGALWDLYRRTMREAGEKPRYGPEALRVVQAAGLGGVYVVPGADGPAAFLMSLRHGRLAATWVCGWDGSAPLRRPMNLLFHRALADAAAAGCAACDVGAAPTGGLRTFKTHLGARPEPVGVAVKTFAPVRLRLSARWGRLFG